VFICNAFAQGVHKKKSSSKSFVENISRQQHRAKELQKNLKNSETRFLLV